MIRSSVLGAVAAFVLLLSTCGQSDSDAVVSVVASPASASDSDGEYPNPGAETDTSEPADTGDGAAVDEVSDGVSDVGTGDRGLFGVNDESGPFGEVGAAVDEGSDEMSVDGAWAAERPSQAHLPGFIEVPWTPSVDLDCWLDAMGSVSTRARAEAIARQLGVGSSPPPYRVHSHRTDGISEAELDAAVSSAAVCSKNDPFYGAPECARASEDSVEVVEELVRAWLLDAMPGPATIQLMGDCREYWKAEAAVELASTGLDPQDAECAATELIEAFLRFYRASYDASQAATPAASSELVEDAARDLFIDSTLGTMIYCSLDRAEVKAITGIDPDTIPGG